jgi:hypothetical protein
MYCNVGTYSKNEKTDVILIYGVCNKNAVTRLCRQYS